MTMERYVDIKKISKYTSLPVAPLYEWSSTGRIPSIKIGRRVLYDLHDVDTVMAGLKRPCNRSDTVANKIIGDIQGYES